MMRKSSIAVLIMFAMVKTVNAADYMSADEVKAAFAGKTFDGVYLPKNKSFSVYEDPDGTHHVLRPSGKRDKNREWLVNDAGQHCATYKKTGKLRCSYVLDAGNGELHKYNDEGEHTHTLTNFRNGNQL